MTLVQKTAVVIVALLFVGCAGTSTVSRVGAYQEQIGTTTRNDVEREAREVLIARYGYRLDRAISTQEDIRYITMWAEDTPLSDEKAEGITNVRTRILLTARPKNRTTNTYRARYRAEYEVQRQNSGNWERAEITEMREEYLDEIAEYLEDQLASGVRSY